MTQQPTKNMSRDVGIALLLLLLSLILNVVGIRWGVPSEERMQYYAQNAEWYLQGKTNDSLYWTTPYETYHPDEGFVLDALTNMSPGDLDFNPRFFNYPTLWIYVTAVGLKSAEFANYLTIVNDKSYYISNPEQMARIYLVGRFLAGAMGSVGVALLYALTRLLYGNRKIAFIAALILAITPIWVRNSHFMLVNVPSTTWLIASALFAVWAIRSQRVSHLYLGALMAGFAASTKYTSGAIVIVVVYALWHMRNLPQLVDWSARIRTFVAITLISIVGFLLGTPYALIDRDQFINDLVFEGANKLSLPTLGTMFNHLVYSLGTPLLLLTAVGTVLLIWQWRNWRTHVVALIFLGGMAQRLLTDIDFVRYLIPALPALAIAAAYAIGAFWQRLEAAKQPPHLAWALCIAILAPTLLYSLDIVNIMRGDDVRNEAAAWLIANEPSDPLGIYQSIYYHSPPFDADRFDITWMSDIAGETPPSTILLSSEHDNLWGGDLPPDSYELESFGRFPSPIWTWPLTDQPHDWGYTFLRIDWYQSPTQEATK